MLGTRWGIMKSVDGGVKGVLGIVALGFLLVGSWAQATIIDNFNSRGVVESGTTIFPAAGISSTLNDPDDIKTFVNSVGLNALGGYRKGTLDCLSACTDPLGDPSGLVSKASLPLLSVSPLNRALAFSNDSGNPGVVGRLDLRYDGTKTGGTLSESGGSLPTTNILDVDFTAGGATEIFTKVLFADLGLRLGFAFYGSTAPGAPAASAGQIATLIIDVAAGASDHHLSFTTFGGNHYITNAGVSSCGQISGQPVPAPSGCPNTGGFISPGWFPSTVQLGGFDFHHVGAVDFEIVGFSNAADGTIDFIDTSSPVPEPVTLLSLGTGLCGLGLVGYIWRRRKESLN